MNEDFVTAELAVKLKEKGFRMPCIAHYCCLDGNVLKFNITTDYIRGSNIKCLNGENNIYTDAPTISQVLKWLREEKNIHIVIDITNYGFISSTISFKWVKSYCENEIEHYDHKGYSTNEEATLAEIEYVLDNLI